MKKLIYVILLIFTCISCYKIEVYKPELFPGYFNDEITVGDSLEFHINCYVSYKDANIQFVKKKCIFKKTWEENIGSVILTMKKDTVTVLMEEYNYSPLTFKYMLKEKNTIPRDTTIFKFDGNMYCSWKIFDEIYNTYK